MRSSLSLLPILLLHATGLFAQETHHTTIHSYFKEVESATQKHDGLWKYNLYAPILLVDKTTRAVYANMPDSAGKLQATEGIYTGILPNDINIANTSKHWAGRHWAMVMLPLSENKNSRINLLTHELFHRAQPYLQLEFKEADNSHLDEKEGRIYLRLELEALKEALLSKSRNDVNKHLKNALIFRKFRYDLYPDAAKNENLTELNEGLAEFTGVMVSERSLEQMKQHFTNHIERFLLNQTFIRSFPYETVPIYGYLLSHRNPGWNLSINQNTNLTEHLIRSLGIKMPSSLKAEVIKITGAYYGNKIREDEELRESKILTLKDEFRKKFILNPHLELGLENMNISFDYTNIMPLDDHGVVYPTIRVTDNWGILTVTQGALMSPNWNKITVSEPTDLTSRNIKGEGWSLELNELYTIRQDIFTRNYYVAKK